MVGGICMCVCADESAQIVTIERGEKRVEKG